MDLFLWCMLGMLIFLGVDLWAFAATPHEFRTAGGRWWRMLPGGGIAVLIVYKCSPQQ